MYQILIKSEYHPKKTNLTYLPFTVRGFVVKLIKKAVKYFQISPKLYLWSLHP